MAKEQTQKFKDLVDKAKALENSVNKPEPTVDPSLPRWNCRVDGAPADGQWTVGEVFQLECSGPRAELHSTNIQFKLDEKQKYSLHVLSVDKQSDNSLSMKVTSYTTGNHDFKNLQIEEGGQARVIVEPIQLGVKSVRDPKQQKPFGPILAMKMAYPNWLWVVLAVAIILPILWGLLRFRKNIQMKKVISELKQHNTALGAFNQFNKELRTLRRKNVFKEDWSVDKKQRYIENLDEIFRMYLLREFYIPALDWNAKQITKEIASSDRKSYGAYGDALKKFLKEIERDRGDVDKLQVHDCKQLTQMALKVTQRVWQKRKDQ